MQLSSHQKRYLRGIAHALDPVIMVGQKGVTPAVLKEFDGALTHHELVKVKLADADREDREETIEVLRESSKSELVQTIGRIACFYRRNPQQPKIELPRPRKNSPMQLTQDPAEGYLFVRACAPRAITIVDREITRSFVLAPDRVVENWPVTSAAEFDAAAAESIAALDPEVVLLGTGERQVFPPREALVALLRRRIGVEVMDNAAASRTYNLLVSEGRRAVAAFMLPNE